MRSELRPAALAATTLLAAVLVPVPGWAAVRAADEHGLQLSRDGRTWTSALSVPVLDEDVRLVPGGSTRSDLWIRNGSPRATTLTVTTRRIHSTLSRDVAPRDDFRVRVAGRDVPTSDGSGCRVVRTVRLAPGESDRVRMSVSLPGSSRDVSERRTVTVPIRVSLVEGATDAGCDEAAPPSGPDQPTPPQPPPESPGAVQTDGGPWVPPLSTDLLAAGLLAAAVAVVIRRRGRGPRGRRAS